jgi:hypothetical protein
MSIRIKIKINHPTEQYIAAEVLQDWVEEQSVLTIEEAEVWGGDNIDIIPYFLSEVHDPMLVSTLEESFNTYLENALREMEAAKSKEIPWYQVNERFSIDYI